jgi:hypothetical protein
MEETIEMIRRERKCRNMSRKGAVGDERCEAGQLIINET